VVPSTAGRGGRGGKRARAASGGDAPLSAAAAAAAAALLPMQVAGRKGRAASAVTGVFPPSPLPPPLLRFIEEELSRTPFLIQRVTAAAISQLQHASRPEATSSRDERLVRSEVMESLLSSTPEFTQLFADKLREIVTHELGGQLQITASGGQSDTTGFDLVDESRVDADIEISRATQAIDQAAEWELRELQTFTSALAGQTHVIAHSNPLRPAVYAQARWHATCAITPRLTHRRLLLRTVAGCLAGQLKMSWAAACTRLEDQGIEPSAYKTTAFPSGAASDAAKAKQAGAQRLDHLLSRMPGAAPGGGALPAPATGASTAGPSVSAAATTTTMPIASGTPIDWNIGLRVKCRQNIAPAIVRPDPRMTWVVPWNIS
jgi:hypothetical protein